MKIAIVKLSALGDIVHATVVIQFIKKHNPSIEIDWIVEENFAPILEGDKDISNILTLNLKSIKKNPLKIFRELWKIHKYSKNQYDLVIDLQGLLKSAMVSRMLGANVAGFAKNCSREPLSAFFYSKKYEIDYEENVILRNIYLVEKSLEFNFNKELLYSKRPALHFGYDDIQKVQKYLKKDQKNIMIICGSSWPTKVYPKEKMEEIIKNLDANIIAVWGSEEENYYAAFLAQKANITIPPKLPFCQLKALIASCNLVIGGDSGPTHMAWALNVPSITIFGPTPSKRNALVTKINKTIDTGKLIDPYKLNKKDTCINEIQEDRIIKIAKELLCLE